VLLVRHGENEWVTSGRLAGRAPHVHLNEKGHAQAKTLAEMLAQQPIAAVYSSPLERCVETAQPLANVLGLPVCVEPGIVEVDYGAWMGADLKELNKLPEWFKVQHFPSSFRFPGGETLRETQQRAVEAVERLAAAHPNQTIVLFSHGDIIRTLIAHFAGTPIDLFQRVQISTASLTTLALFDGRPALLNVNVTAELPIYEVKPPQADGDGEQPVVAPDVIPQPDTTNV
jgi:probable phosphoglycerate mutase